MDVFLIVLFCIVAVLLINQYECLSDSTATAVKKGATAGALVYVATSSPNAFTQSTAEHSAEEKPFPWWGILLIVLGSVGLLSVAGYGVYKYRKNQKIKEE